MTHVGVHYNDFFWNCKQSAITYDILGTSGIVCVFFLFRLLFLYPSFQKLTYLCQSVYARIYRYTVLVETHFFHSTLKRHTIYQRIVLYQDLWDDGIFSFSLISLSVTLRDFYSLFVFFIYTFFSASSGLYLCTPHQQSRELRFISLLIVVWWWLRICHMSRHDCHSFIIL